MRAKIRKKSAVLSVSAGKGCYRHIKVPMNKKLSYLAETILDCFEFQNDHLYSFYMGNRLGEYEGRYDLSPYAPDVPGVDEYRLDEVGLCTGKQFKFLFDYGDEWVFQCKVLRIEESDISKYEVIKSVGDPPEQYPDYDDEWDEDDEDEWDEDDEDEWDEDDEDEWDEDDEFEQELFRKSIKKAVKNEKPSFEEVNYRMVSDELLKASAEFYKAKGQKKAYFYEPFAIKLSNGKNGYCAYDSENQVVFLFIGDSGWKMYSKLFESEGREINEAEFSEDSEYLFCDFVPSSEMDSMVHQTVKSRTEAMGMNLRKFPFFLYRKAMYMPEPFSETYQSDLMTEAMKACKYVFSNLTKFRQLLSNGLMFGKLLCLTPDGNGYTADEIQAPPPAAPEVTSPAVKTDKLPKKGKWVCDICATPHCVADAHNSYPHHLKALVMLRTDCESTFPNTTFDPDTPYREIVKYMVMEFAALGYYPKEIIVRNERTEILLEKFCKSAGIKLVRVKDIPLIDECLSCSAQSVNSIRNKSNDSDIVRRASITKTDNASKSLPKYLEAMLSHPDSKEFFALFSMFLEKSSFEVLKNFFDTPDKLMVMKKMSEHGIISKKASDRMRKLFNF